MLKFRLKTKNVRNRLMSEQHPMEARGKQYFDDTINELRSPRTQSFFDKSLLIRILLIGCFGLFLFFFLHFQETSVENLELGTNAKRYVVAQVDFAFPDEEATIILRQEAAREIGSIYRIKNDDILNKITGFQKYIARSEEEISQDGGFKDIAIALNLFSDALFSARFTDIRTVDRIEDITSHELPLSLDNFYVFLPPSESMTSKLPSQVWNALIKQTFAEKEIGQDIVQRILNYFQTVEWKFESDQGLEYTIRKLIQMGIPQMYTPVSAGDRIIDRGEKVTSRHVAMILAMKEKMAEKRNLFDPFTLSGSFLLTMLFLFISGIYLKENQPEVVRSNRKLALLASIIVLNLIFAKAVELFLIKTSNSFVDIVRFPLFVPFAAILLASLMNLKIAMFATFFLSIVFALGLSVEGIPFLVVNIVTSMVALLGTRQIRRRKEVFWVCAKAWVASFLVVLAFNLYANTAFSLSIISDLGNTLLFMLATAVFVVGLLPILESLFQIMTDITLMEFMDPSNELLRRLTVEAPGTYQHSIVVGNLAEAAASAIGANGLFCRVATQYHDVGKLANPQYFTENQLGGVDMHQLLTPLESAQVILAHVSEGVTLARKMSLPEPFIDIIKEHHGTTLVYYFYHKQLELVEGDKKKIDEKDFRYSGPKPRSKESTIIMIADSFEAASRTLDIFTEQTISELIDNLVAQKMEDGQFDESLLTFEELNVVKRAVVKTLLAASHARVKYPPHHPGEEG